MKIVTRLLPILVFMQFFIVVAMAANPISPKKKIQLESDLSKVWPFIQTVKVEYELVMAQLETIECDSVKKEFLLNYENYVKESYFDKVVKLNVRQGKLLLLLIDRELKRTPYDLLVQFLNQERADFWQSFAKILDADLKQKYSAILHPEMELIILKLSRERKHDYLLPK